MRWEIEMAVGGVLVAIGLALSLTLPPPWWPNMGRHWLELGLCAGVGVLIPGICLVVVAACRAVNSEAPARIVAGWDAIWTRIPPVRFIFAVVATVILLPLVHVLAAPSDMPASAANPTGAAPISQHDGQTTNNGAAKTLQPTNPTEVARQQALLQSLTREYLSQPNHRSPVPLDWINQRLADLNEDWMVVSKVSSSHPAVSIKDSVLENKYPGGSVVIMEDSGALEVTDSKLSATGAPVLIVKRSGNVSIRGSELKSAPTKATK